MVASEKMKAWLRSYDGDKSGAAIRERAPIELVNRGSETDLLPETRKHQPREIQCRDHRQYGSGCPIHAQTGSAAGPAKRPRGDDTSEFRQAITSLLDRLLTLEQYAHPASTSKAFSELSISYSK